MYCSCSSSCTLSMGSRLTCTVMTIWLRSAIKSHKRAVRLVTLGQPDPDENHAVDQIRVERVVLFLPLFASHSSPAQRSQMPVRACHTFVSQLLAQPQHQPHTRYCLVFYGIVTMLTLFVLLLFRRGAPGGYPMTSSALRGPYPPLSSSPLSRFSPGLFPPHPALAPGFPHPAAGLMSPGSKGDLSDHHHPHR